MSTGSPDLVLSTAPFVREGATTPRIMFEVLSDALLVLLAALLLIPTFLVPLWNMTFVAQQYPEGLDLYIFSHNLVGGDDGNDLTEINVLNHYIGMAELRPADFTELKHKIVSVIRRKLEHKTRVGARRSFSQVGIAQPM